MNVQETKEQLIAELIRLAFAEDIGDGDHTTLCCIPATEMGKSQLIVKEDGVLAGVEMAERIFHTFDPDLKMTTFIHDGAEVKKGDIAFVVEGKVQSLLQTERLMLNVMQRMSGIATTTRKYVKALEGTKTRVLDTRKTTPGLRMVEKEAVKIGGGVNHRIGLFDMILLKDNHVDFAGGIEAAITRCHQYLKEKNKDLKIEIEVRTSTSYRKQCVSAVSTVSCWTTSISRIRRKPSKWLPDVTSWNLQVASHSPRFAIMPNAVWIISQSEP